MLTWPKIAAMNIQATIKSIILAKLFMEIKDFATKPIIKNVTKD